ncbi:MAG: Sulfotransferase family protein [Bacteroidetes bacterium]|nr:Sulfotransferase family protein [Bacteroidota bacterium]
MVNPFINRIFYRLWQLKHRPVKNADPAVAATAPLFIGGMFRSGTSLVTKLLMDNGFDAGPENHLLQPIGFRKTLNPTGFFENYLFMEWSMLYMKLHGMSGASMNEPERWKTIMEMNIREEEFARFCILENSDDRISNKNKVDVLKNYSSSNLDQYIQQNFGANPIIKNPHFTLFFNTMFQHWPHSKLLLVFQHPQQVLNSVNSKMLPVDPLLYKRYYEKALNANDPRIAFFSLEQLFADPEGSLQALSAWTGKKMNTKATLAVRETKLQTQQQLPAEVLDIYERLKQNCINKNR